MSADNSSPSDFKDSRSGAPAASAEAPDQGSSHGDHPELGAPGQKPQIPGSPSFKLLLIHLKCGYCGLSPLQEIGSWFTFRRGCLGCNYRYERELGYFTGASWMITFPFVSFVSFLAAAFFLWFLPAISALMVASIVGFLMIALGVAVTPFAMALWIYIEHRLHPLNNQDSYHAELLN